MNSASSQRRLLEDVDPKVVQEGNSDSGNNIDDVVHAAIVENNGALEDAIDSSCDIFRDAEDIPYSYSYDYDDYVDDG